MTKFQEMDKNRLVKIAKGETLQGRNAVQPQQIHAGVRQIETFILRG